ncbi:hypothetical protein ABTM90_20305, partial [Acinetobacter baumannii]
CNPTLWLPSVVGLSFPEPRHERRGGPGHIRVPLLRVGWPGHAQTVPVHHWTIADPVQGGRRRGGNPGS